MSFFAFILLNKHFLQLLIFEQPFQEFQILRHNLPHLCHSLINFVMILYLVFFIVKVVVMLMEVEVGIVDGREKEMGWTRREMGDG